MQKSLWLLAACVVGLGLSMPGCAQQGGNASNTGGTVGASPGIPVTVDVDLSGKSTAIPQDFLGLSLETQTLLPDAQGRHYFRADNAPLVTLYKTLGVKNLRIGGNTADTPSIPIPTEKDIDDLFAFAKAANVEVIYTLRLRNATDPSADAAVAKYIMDHYGSQVLCFEIGNEPNVYAKTYPQYKTLLSSFIAAIRKEGVAPNARFCGPNTTGGEKPPWPGPVARDFGGTGAVPLITQHAYFGGNSRKVTDQAASRDAMLSPKWLASYQKRWDSFVPDVIAAHLPYRIEETNSFFNGGAKDVSNTHAAALWALDYLHWWAAHDAAGINFHTGDHVAAADEQTPCWYASYWTSDKGYHVHPVGYAVKAFDVGGHGTSVPVTVHSKAPETPNQATTRLATTQSTGGLNITAYGVKGADGHLFVTLINKEHGTGGQAAAVTLDVPGYSHASTMALTTSSGDIAATEGETLGGAPIGDQGHWAGRWTPAEGHVISVPAATAVVVQLSE